MSSQRLATSLALTVCFAVQMHRAETCSGQELQPTPREIYEQIPTRDDPEVIQVEPQELEVITQQPELRSIEPAKAIEAAAAPSPQTPLTEHSTEAPAIEAPAIEAPAIEAPAIEAPAIEAPAIEAPAIEARAIAAPAIHATPESGPEEMGFPILESTMPIPTVLEPQVLKSMAPAIVQKFRDGFSRGMKLPTHFSLREYLPEAGDQGKKNNCVAWAVAYANYSCQVCQERRRKNPTLKSDIFSPKFIYKDLGKNNKPLFVVDVIDHVWKVGCATRATMDSKSPNDEIVEAKNFKPERQNRRASSLNDMKAYLSEGYPVVLMVKLDQGFRNRKRSDNPYQWSGRRKGKKPSYHAVTAVGYNDERKAVEIMNSWGTDWGNDGFCWVSYENFKPISDKNWCSEAHIIPVKRIAPYNVYMETRTPGSSRPRERRFELTDARKVLDEQGKRISPKGWKIDDVACTKDTLFILTRDQVVCRMNGSGEERSWTHLDNGIMAGKKATMLAADETTTLHALTSDHKLLRFDTNSGRWSPAKLPSNAGNIVDLRIRRRTLFATNINGKLYEKNSRNQWKPVR